MEGPARDELATREYGKQRFPNSGVPQLQQHGPHVKSPRRPQTQHAEPGPRADRQVVQARWWPESANPAMLGAICLRWRCQSGSVTTAARIGSTNSSPSTMPIAAAELRTIVAIPRLSSAISARYSTEPAAARRVDGSSATIRSDRRRQRAGRQQPPGQQRAEHRDARRPAAPDRSAVTALASSTIHRRASRSACCRSSRCCTRRRSSAPPARRSPPGPSSTPVRLVLAGSAAQPTPGQLDGRAGRRTRARPCRQPRPPAETRPGDGPLLGPFGVHRGQHAAVTRPAGASKSPGNSPAPRRCSAQSTSRPANGPSG